MKRIILFFSLVIITTITANAQYRNGQSLVCLKNGVLLRTGPGKNYPAVTDGYHKEIKIILVKPGVGYLESAGEEVSASDETWAIDFSLKYLGKKQNGFLYVVGEKDGDIFDNFVFKGWVPEKYIRAACSRCDGWCADPKKNEYFCPAWQYYDGDYVKCTQCHGRGY